MSLMPGYEFIEARFIDQNHMNLSTIWKSPDGNFLEEIVPADPESREWKELMKVTTEREIFDNTAEYKLQEKRKFDAYVLEVGKPLIEEKAAEAFQEAESLKEERDSKIEEIIIMRAEIAELNNVLLTMRDELDTAWGQAEDKWKKDELISKLNNTIGKLKEDLSKKVEPKFKTKLNSLRVEGSIFKEILRENTSDDLLFKTKLEIFDLPKLKESKDRNLKTSIRKSKSFIELMGLVKEYI